MTMTVLTGCDKKEEEMRTLIEICLEEQEEELPGDEFYYPLPEITDEEIVDVEEAEVEE